MTKGGIEQDTCPVELDQVEEKRVKINLEFVDDLVDTVDPLEVHRRLPALKKESS